MGESRTPAETGLPGRGQLESAIAQLRRSERSASVLFVSMGGLLAVNSRLGREAGDRFILDAARVVVAAVDGCGGVFHLNANRFLVLLSHGISRLEGYARIQGTLQRSVLRREIEFPFSPLVLDLGDMATLPGDALWHALAEAEAEVHNVHSRRIEGAYAKCEDLDDFASVTITHAQDLFGARGVELTLCGRSWSGGVRYGLPATLPLERNGTGVGSLALWGLAGFEDPRGLAAVRTLTRCMATIAERIHYRQQALRDPLTGLLNRRGVDEAVQRVAGPLAVALLDIDDFKVLNDTYGHDAGDHALQQVATLLESGRSTDIVGRWGGEEFVVVLPGEGTEGLKSWLDRTLEAARSQIKFGVGLTFSAGIVAVKGREEFSSAIAAADRLLYRAKREGRAKIIEGVVEPSTATIDLPTITLRPARHRALA